VGLAQPESETMNIYFGLLVCLIAFQICLGFTGCAMYKGSETNKRLDKIFMANGFAVIWTMGLLFVSIFIRIFWFL
jgi:hypothetical protein